MKNRSCSRWSKPSVPLGTVLVFMVSYHYPSPCLCCRSYSLRWGRLAFQEQPIRVKAKKREEIQKITALRHCSAGAALNVLGRWEQVSWREERRFISVTPRHFFSGYFLFFVPDCRLWLCCDWQILSKDGLWSALVTLGITWWLTQAVEKGTTQAWWGACCGFGPVAVPWAVLLQLLFIADR